jgi:transposase
VAEFGLTAAKGKAHLVPPLERIQADESVPVLARELFAAQAKEYARPQGQIDEVDAELMAWHKADERRRLAKIPGRSDRFSRDAEIYDDALCPTKTTNRDAGEHRPSAPAASP